LLLPSVYRGGKEVNAMYGAELFDFSLWWVFPLVMMVFCFFMMRGRGGSMCGFGSHSAGSDGAQATDSAKGILERRYARGEIDRTEYEEKSKVLVSEHDAHTG
jgi:uncharacterized membrane protein